MRRKKINPQHDPKEWAPLFSTLGISIEDALKMTSTEFENNCVYLESIGINPKNPPIKKSDAEIKSEIISSIGKPKNRNIAHLQRTTQNNIPNNQIQGNLSNNYNNNRNFNNNSLSKTSELRNQQDEEYQQALKEEQEKELLLKEQEKSNSDQKPSEEEQQNQKDSPPSKQIVDIGPEPEEGLHLLFKLPSGQRLSRVFDKNSIGNILYIFVENNPEIFNQEREIILTDSFGHQCDRTLSLMNQNIQDRTFFIVSFRQ